jgi:hypothetical protein
MRVPRTEKGMGLKEGITEQNPTMYGDIFGMTLSVREPYMADRVILKELSPYPFVM